MKNLVIGLMAAAVGATLAAAPASANVNSFTGSWVNVSAATRGVTKLRIRRNFGQVRVRAFGQCHPTDCNWGVVRAIPFGPSPGVNALARTRALMARFSPSFARKTMIIERAGPNRLRVKVLTRFVDGSGRQAYTRTYLFRRALNVGPVLPDPVVSVPPVVREDCVAFNPFTTRVRRFGSTWKLVDGNHHMKSFGNKAGEAFRALQLIRSYRLNRLCFVGRPGPSMEYWKRNNKLPVGPRAGQDCVSINPFAASVRFINGRWTIAQGSHLIKAFPNRPEARKGLAIMRKHRARYSCFVGRPGPSMTYLRR